MATAVYIKLYLLLALSAVLIFSSMVNCQRECIEARPPLGQDSSGFSQAENITTTDCPDMACYERCLKPNITLKPGMDAYAACTVPRSEHPRRYQNTVQMFFYPPGDHDQCVVFQSKTHGVWHHHNKHVHFRGKDETVEVFIVDVNMRDHHNLSVVCRASRTNGMPLESCSEENSTATIYVVEADSESTVPASIPTDDTFIRVGTDCPQMDCSECTADCPQVDNSGCTKTICLQMDWSGCTADCPQMDCGLSVMSAAVGAAVSAAVGVVVGVVVGILLCCYIYWTI